jgi:hypothetical protein
MAPTFGLLISVGPRPVLDHRRCAVILALLLVVFVAVTVPGSFKGSSTASAVFLHEPDAPIFVLPSLMELYDGRLVPKFRVYGHFPAYFSAALFAPVLLPMKLLHGSIDYFYFVLAMRVSQLVMAVVAVIYVYRLGLLCLPPPWALAAVALVLSMSEFCKWTLTIHPDIYQAAAIVAAEFYLARHLRNGRRRDLCLSAACAGVATAAKLYGVFVLPAVAVAVFSGRIAGFRLEKKSLVAAINSGLLYLAILLAVFFSFNLRILSFDADVRLWLGLFNGMHSVRGSAGDLFTAKVATIVSPNLFGLFFPLAYVLSAAWLLAVDARRWRNGDFTLHPYQAVHLVVGAYVLYFLVLYSDSFNIYHSERYLLPFMCLLPVSVLLVLRSLFAQPGMRFLGWGLTTAVVLTAAVRGCGCALYVYRPMPVAIRTALYDRIRYGLAEADKQLLSSVYQVAPGSGRARLRGDLTAEECDRALDFWRNRSYLLTSPSPFWRVLAFPYRKERFATFKTRAWIAENAPSDAVVYAEPSMNLMDTPLAHFCHSDNDDLPTKNIHTGPIQWETVARLRPDFILTINKTAVDEILGKSEDYQLLEHLVSENEAYIVGRREALRRRIDEDSGKSGSQRPSHRLATCPAAP